MEGEEEEKKQVAQSAAPQKPKKRESENNNTLSVSGKLRPTKSLESSKTSSGRERQQKKTFESLMPIDFLKEKQIYRIDVQKYEDSEELDLDNLVRHIFKSEKKGILFAFDVTEPKTYERYVKKALERMLQFTQENTEKEFRMPPPFVLLGMKADLEAQVVDSDVQSLVIKLR